MSSGSGRTLQLLEHAITSSSTPRSQHLHTQASTKYLRSTCSSRHETARLLPSLTSLHEEIKLERASVRRPRRETDQVAQSHCGEQTTRKRVINVRALQCLRCSLGECIESQYWSSYSDEWSCTPWQQFRVGGDAQELEAAAAAAAVRDALQLLLFEKQAPAQLNKNTNTDAPTVIVSRLQWCRRLGCYDATELLLFLFAWRHFIDS